MERRIRVQLTNWSTTLLSGTPRYQGLPNETTALGNFWFLFESLRSKK